MPHDNKETKETNEEYQVAIQTTSGSYEARLPLDNSNNFPLQKKMNIARYIIAEPPYMMRIIPKYHITKKLQGRQKIRHTQPITRQTTVGPKRIRLRTR